MSKPIIALQLYTVRDFTEQDLPGTLRAIKAMGYDAVELAGTYGLETAEFKKHLDTAGLKAVSAHVSIHAFEADVESTVSQYKSLDCSLLSIPSLPMASLPGGDKFDATKAILAKAAAQCKGHGIQLAYHNHAYEFQKLPCGSFILDALFDATSPEVLQAQIDTGWVTAAGEDASAYVQKYIGRCPSVHLKDIIKVGDKFEDRPVGKGMQDIPAVIKTAIQAGATILVVELDEAVGMTSMDAARESREYLQALGYM